MPRSLDDWRRSEATSLPGWIKPQLTRLVDQAPDGAEWLHEIKFDGYRMHARLDRGAVRLLTRTGLDWTHKYPAIAAAVLSLRPNSPAGMSAVSAFGHAVVHLPSHGPR